MIIGNGLMGTAFRVDEKRYGDYIIFASGVSDSKCSDINAFKREEDLVNKTISEYPDLVFVYISTILSDMIDNDYYYHKLKMEIMVQEKSKNFIIFRVPQIIGVHGNSNNLFKHFLNNIKANKINEVYHGVERSIIDVEDFKSVVDYCIVKTRNKVINLSYIEKISVYRICNKIYSRLNKPRRISIKTAPSNQNWDVDNSEIVKEALTKLNIMSDGYTDKIIAKYIN
jgi:hypothetical protein